MTITTADGKVAEGLEQAPFEPIAVVGVGAMMPDADDIEQFWQNIVDAKVSIKDVEQSRWPGKKRSTCGERRNKGVDRCQS